jgi:hypothetical protein
MKKNGPSKYLAPNTFTVCTIDNIDKAMPCASVKSTDERRPAMHATSMCFMQPAPQKLAKPATESPGTCIVCGCEMSENAFGNTCLKCEVLTDDDNILGKPRSRSMAESGRSEKSESHVKVPPMIPRYSQQKVLSIDDFKITEIEENAMKSIATDELTYALQRTVHASEFSDEEKRQTPLPDLRCKLYLEQKDQEIEKSKYAYIPLLYKHADDIDTVDECLDIIQGHASKIQSRTEPLVVAGDAKTFDHLQALKKNIWCTTGLAHSICWRFPHTYEHTAGAYENFLGCGIERNSKTEFQD